MGYLGTYLHAARVISGLYSRQSRNWCVVNSLGDKGEETAAFGNPPHRTFPWKTKW
jgi:hypothetical protein